ncbi:MAG TPA: proline--tRNA ligase [Nitrososphaerales archaeon]|nr:proline--tRNA ligase [Nitrososphaerales archaeon]
MSKASQEGMTAKKKDNFDDWYTQVILKAELADYSPVSGCMVFRPAGYAIWENIQRATDIEFKKAGIANSYFPIFIPERLLKKEAEHVQGFAPEVAWVTQAGSSELDERLAIRPTSETLMYEVVSKWIRSWRDLPMRLNQWNNVVRWEFKHPTPFLRSREFLWNEGHTLFATRAEADAERDEILGIYRKITEEFMALPGYLGRKSKTETFAGAEATFSIEHLLPDGKAIQGPDWHSDGQNFSKAFEIVFVDQDGDKQYAWQNTWAISTREIGVMLAIHSDDKGAVVPPMLSETQVVLVPIVNDESKKAVLAESRKLFERLRRKFRVKLDDRDHLTPGRKFNEWELKGVPLRIEFGPRDMKDRQAVLVRRDTGGKRVAKLASMEREVAKELRAIQASLLQRAAKALAEETRDAATLAELKRILSEHGGIARVPWCGRAECEAKMKEETGGKILNFPIGQKAPKAKCIACGADAASIAYFGKSY